MTTLPGDPREDLNITLGHDGLCGLEENGNGMHEFIGFYSTFNLYALYQ